MNAAMQSELQCVDPADVPQKTLYTGARMPAVGLGTFGPDQGTPDQIAQAVLGAAAVGYRHFDCASIYGNEIHVGAALQKVLASGVTREELWITSKLWNDKHGKDDVIAACKQSLRDLQLDYLDLYLTHWPFSNIPVPPGSASAAYANSGPYRHENFMKTWKKMEELVDMGLVRHIGTSNMTVPKLKLLLRDARIKPAVEQMELHPHFQQRELFEFVLEHRIVPVGYSPLGSPGRPARDRAPGDTAPTEDPVIVKIAQDHGVHPASVCMKWAVQRGQAPIPFSIHRSEYFANLQAATVDLLSEEEMRAVGSIDRNCRLMKGQAFVWRAGQSWEALWDMDCVITPA